MLATPPVTSLFTLVHGNRVKWEKKEESERINCKICWICGIPEMVLLDLFLKALLFVVHFHGYSAYRA